MDDNAKTKPPTFISLQPLVSRLDRLESVINLLEDKKNVSRRGAVGTNPSQATDREHIPMYLAVKEAQSKGSLLDRVAALEDRLLQLCLQLESRGMPLSQTSVVQAFLDTSRRSGSPHPCRELKSSNHQNKPPSQDKVTIHHSVQIMASDQVNRSHKEKKKLMKEAVFEQQTRTGRDKNRFTGPEKATPHSWLHMKILGC